MSVATRPQANPFVEQPNCDFVDVDEISGEQAAEQARLLREAIDFHDYRYYVQNDPVISDRAYDQLFKRLEALEEAFPALQSPNSPTRRVGAAPVSELQRVEHVRPMLSLNAEFEEAGVANFDKFVRDNLDAQIFSYVCEPKFDGLSVEVIFEAGELVRASTRGNGEQGELITDNVRTIHSVPLRLRGDFPEYLAVRGEVIMPLSGFQQLNRRRVEAGEDTFANPRNAAAGAARLLDSSEVARRPLDVFFYEIIDSSPIDIADEFEALDAFSRWGLKVDEHSRRCEDLDAVERFYTELEAARDDLNFEIDGMVIKVNEFAARDQLGMRARSPRWALAWKFTPKKEITTLEDIVVQVGRTGKLTPVALLDPVDVGGVTVSRATLHNLEEVHSKDVRIGDHVRIQRAGDVIPEVVERIETDDDGERAAPFDMPDYCPSCGAEVVREGPNHFCPNGMSCPAQLEGRIQHFAARNAMDIDGLGSETVDQLVDRGLVRAIPDLYELSVEQLVELDRFAEKSATNLYDNIQGSKEVRLDRFLYALGIPMVGQHTARVLAQAFGSLDALRRADEDALLAVAGVGREIAASVVDFFDEARNQQALERLFALGLELQEMPRAEGEAQSLRGKKFVFTGELEQLTRAEAKRLVEDMGGRATSSVSSQTDYVVVGQNPGSKLDKARELGVEILDEAGFVGLTK